MVSTSIRGLDLSDEQLTQLKPEVCDMAMGMLSGGAVPSAPIHEDILLTMGPHIMTGASTVLGAAPHPRGRCAAVPPTTVCPERPFRRPERPVRPSSWRDTMALGIGQPRGSSGLRAWRRRKTQRFRAPRGAAARRGSPSLEKRWLKIHQDAEATTDFEENLAF
jgi:hypothetical protein